MSPPHHGKGLNRGARVSVLTTIGVALIGATATIVAAAISNGSGAGAPRQPPAAVAPQHPAPSMPAPDCSTCSAGGKTFTERAGRGSTKPTYRDPRSFKGQGRSVPAGQQIQVVCRFHDPDAPLSVQPGWWYLIANPPWRRQYYTVANSYLNGDPPQGPGLTTVDNGVPVC